MLTHPMLDQLAQLGLTGMAQAFAELEASGEGATPHPCRLARPAGRSRDALIAATSASPPGCAMPDCATRPSSRMSITALRAVSIARCSTSSPAANGSTRTTI